MVSTATIVSMFVLIVFSFILFAGLILFFRKKTGIAVKPLVIGAVGFIVFSQVLEKALHAAVLINYPHFMQHVWLFSAYGGLAAGIFEEFGRFLLYTWFLKKYYDYKGGISFGIGWGGIEAIVVVLMIALPNIIFATLINSGGFEASFAGKFPSEQLAAMKAAVLEHGVGFYLLGCVERFFTVFFHIALSLLVLLAVMKKKFAYVIYAVLIHAVVDFVPCLFQTGVIKDLWMIELYVAILGIISLMFIKKAEKMVSGAAKTMTDATRKMI